MYLEIQNVIYIHFSWAQMNETNSLKLVFINRSIDVTYNCICDKEMLTPINFFLFFIFYSMGRHIIVNILHKS